jgi:hypothetical protein
MDTSEDTWHQVFEVDLDGAFLASSVRPGT